MHRRHAYRAGRLSASEALQPTCYTGAVYGVSGWVRSFAGPSLGDFVSFSPLALGRGDAKSKLSGRCKGRPEVLRIPEILTTVLRS